MTDHAEYVERRTMQELELYCLGAGVKLQTLIEGINALPDCDEARELAENLEYARQAARNNVERGNTQDLTPLLIDVRRRLEELTARPLVNMARQHSESQAEKARKRWAESGQVTEIIKRLATRADHRDDEPAELWPHLYAALEDAQLSPKEDGNGTRKQYSYNGGTIKYEAFRRLVNRTRKPVIRWDMPGSSNM